MFISFHLSLFPRGRNPTLQGSGLREFWRKLAEPGERTGWASRGCSQHHRIQRRKIRADVRFSRAKDNQHLLRHSRYSLYVLQDEEL